MPEAVLEVEGLMKRFTVSSGIRSRRTSVVTAVDGFSCRLAAGGAIGLVGESGSGKTTTARMLVGLERPDAGTIRVAGRERPIEGTPSASERRRRGREIQIVFQDPYASLDPRQTVADCLDEVVRFHFGWDRDRRRDTVAALIEKVGLGEREARSLPRELSGGQRQRVAIARALAAEPAVLILDEAVSALDVSIRAQILNLLRAIRHETNVAYLFVSHDLGVVRRVTDDVFVMLQGRVVESGPTERLLRDPEHPYTRMLLDSIPHVGWEPSRIAAARKAFAVAG